MHNGLRLVSAMVVVLFVAGCMGSAGPDQAASTEEERTRRTSRGGNPGIVDANGTISTDFGDVDALWGNRTEIRVMDQNVEWHADQRPPLQQYNIASQAIANPCVWGQRQDVYFNNQRVYFDSNEQIVPNGTGKIRLKLDWTISDYAFDDLSYAFRANNANLTQGPLIRKGTPHEFDVINGTWDYFGTGTTGWEFYICVSSDDRGFDRLGHVFYGSFHIEMTLLRGEGKPAATPIKGS